MKSSPAPLVIRIQLLMENTLRMLELLQVSYMAKSELIVPHNFTVVIASVFGALPLSQRFNQPFFTPTRSLSDRSQGNW